jgi:hypothetical protein
MLGKGANDFRLERLSYYVSDVLIPKRRGARKHCWVYIQPNYGCNYFPCKIPLFTSNIIRQQLKIVHF